MSERPTTQTTGRSDWDAERWGFECEPGCGLILNDDVEGASDGSRWICWEDTVAFHKWLGEKIKDYQKHG